MLRIFQKHTKAKPSRHMGGMRGCGGTLGRLGCVSPDFASRLEKGDSLSAWSVRQREVATHGSLLFFAARHVRPACRAHPTCPSCLPTMPTYQRGPIALPQLQHLTILARIHFPCILGHRHFLTRIFFSACLLSSWPCIYLKTSIYLSTRAILPYHCSPRI